MTIEEFLTRLKGVQSHGSYYMARCPCHDDKKASLSISQGRNGGIVLKCHAGCSTEDITAELGLKMSDLFPDDRRRATAERDFKRIEKRKPVAYYQYRDTGGNLIAEKIRYSDKSFSWRKPDGRHGWTYNRRGIEKMPLYGQNAVHNGIVYLAEGEKDVDTLTSFGLCAMCSPDGAGHDKWKPYMSEPLRDCDVRVIQDNDTIGKAFAAEICTALQGIAKSVKLLDLSQLWPDIPEHGDVTDYVEWCRKSGAKDQAIFLVLDGFAEDVPNFSAAESPPEYPEEKAPLPLPASVSEIDFDAVQRYRFVISEILPEGVTFLNAYAKTGKSRVILQMCLAVCWGAPFMGHDTEKSAVLYCALEDEMSDFAPRLELMLRGQPAPKNFYYFTKEAFDNSPPHLGENGGLAQLIDQALQVHPDIALVCIDVFGGIRSELDGYMNFTDHERKDLDELVKIAADHRIALVVAHHVGKNGERSMSAGNDFMGSGAGSFTIPATVHSVWYMARDKDDESRMMLAYRGRRIKSGSIALRDKYPGFELEGDWEAVTFADDPVVATIKWLVKQYGQWKGTVKDLMTVNGENLNELPQILKKPNKNTIENLARQLQSVGIRYIQHSRGSTNSTIHEFQRADYGVNFIEVEGSDPFDENEKQESL